MTRQAAWLSGKRLEVCTNSRAFVGGVALAAGSMVSVCISTYLCIGSAQAADLPVARRPAAVAPVVFAPPVYNWSGIYVGGNLGAGFAHSSWSDPFTGADTDLQRECFA